MKKLSPKHQQFVAEYLKDFNATRAAKSAGYSEKTAHVQGCNLLKNPKIAEHLRVKHGRILDKLEISRERVLEGIARLAFFDSRKFYNPDGSLKAITELDDETMYALQGMDVEKLYKHFAKGAAQEVGTVSKVKLADRGINLERLGRVLNMFDGKKEQGELGEKLLGVLERAFQRQ